MNATTTAVAFEQISFANPLEGINEEMLRRYGDEIDDGQTLGEVKVHHFTGYDSGQRSGPRKPRPTATPDFEIEITQQGESEPESYVATIVANNVPDKGNVRIDEPVAIAKVALTEDDYDDDSRWFLLITATDGGRLTPSQVLIGYDGDPLELFEKTHLFDNE